MYLKTTVLVLSLPNKPVTCVINRTLGEGGRGNSITVKASIIKYPYLQLRSTLTMSTAQMTWWIFFCAALASVHAADDAWPHYEHGT